MKKEFFFFNLNALSPFFLKKATLCFLPIKYLIRSLNFKNSTLTLMDTFSFFFILKLSKFFFFNPVLKLKKNVTKIPNTFFYATYPKKNTGNFLFLDRVVYSSPNKLQISFKFFKQFLFSIKNKFLYSFINHLKFINTYKKIVTFFKKKTLKKGLLKHYFSGIVIFKRGKVLNKKQMKTNKNFYLTQPILINANSSFFFKNKQNYILAIKKLYFLTRVFGNIKFYNKKTLEIKLFALRKKLYKKDFRYTIFLNTKIKRYYSKKKKKN
jgi:hypothetical protein